MKLRNISILLIKNRLMITKTNQCMNLMNLNNQIGNKQRWNFRITLIGSQMKNIKNLDKQINNNQVIMQQI